MKRGSGDLGQSEMCLACRKRLVFQEACGNSESVIVANYGFEQVGVLIPLRNNFRISPDRNQVRPMMEGTGIQYPDCHPLYRAASIGLPPPVLLYTILLYNFVDHLLRVGNQTGDYMHLVA